MAVRVARLLCPLAQASHRARRSAISQGLGLGRTVMFPADRHLTEYLIDTLPGINPGARVLRSDMIVWRGGSGINLTNSNDFVMNHLVAADDEGFWVEDTSGEGMATCPPHHVCIVTGQFVGHIRPRNPSDDYYHVHCHVVTSIQAPEKLSGLAQGKPNDEQLVFEYLPPFAVPYL